MDHIFDVGKESDLMLGLAIRVLLTMSFATGAASESVQPAVSTYELSCTKGDAAACFALGRAYFLGQGVDRSPERAIGFLIRSCDDGIADGCYLLGHAYATGDGAAFTQTLADDYQARGARIERGQCAEGRLEACTALAVRLVHAEFMNPDDDQAAQLLRRACDGGSTTGCLQLGELLLSAREDMKDLPQALAAFERACKDGSPSGCCRLGESLAEGDDGKRDLARARELFKRGIKSLDETCREQDKESCLAVGRFYSQGPFHDDALAIAYFEKACANGSGHGCLLLGSHAVFGLGVQRDEARGRSLIRRATALLTRACDQGDANGCHELAEALDNERGLQKNPPLLVAVRQRSCEAFDANWRDCYELGQMYQFGDGVERSPHQALHYYRKACNGGVAVGCEAAAQLLETGAGVSPDPNQAARLYAKACGSGDCLSEGFMSCCYLGLMYKDGRGVQRDLEHAESLLEKACCLFTPACEELQKPRPPSDAP